MKIIQRFIIVMIILQYIGFFYSLKAQNPMLFSREIFVNNNHDTLKYRLLFPDYNTSRKYPLVIFLHGSGERGNDNEIQLKWGVMNFATDENMVRYPALVIAPQCPEEMNWANLEYDEKTGQYLMLPTPSKPMYLLIELIHQLEKKLPVDKNRIYITGLSMGGFGTFEAMMRYPDLFAAAVPVCGGGDTKHAADIAKIPTWIFHGAEDPAVLTQASIDMFNALVKAGAKPGCTFYPEMGHFAWLAAYSDLYLFEWLFRQHK